MDLILFDESNVIAKISPQTKFPFLFSFIVIKNNNFDISYSYLVLKEILINNKKFKIDVLIETETEI